MTVNTECFPRVVVMMESMLDLLVSTEDSSVNIVDLLENKWDCRQQQTEM